MKTLFLSLALSATALMATTQVTVTQSEKDVTAIKAVVERETTAWNNREGNRKKDCGDMTEMVKGYFHHLTDGESDAIYACLQTLPNQPLASR